MAISDPSARVGAPVLGRQERARAAVWWRKSARFSRRQPIGTASGVVLVALVFAAVFAGVLAPYDPIKNNVGPILTGPGSGHLFGTDAFGRDVFSRVLYGARTSLFVGIVATLIGVVVATFIGAISGYLGGVLDYVVQRFVDVAQAIPPLIFLLGVMIVLGPSTLHVVLALGVRTALSLSRVVRGSVISVKTEAYVEAARSTGATQARLLVRHVLPNVFSVVVVLVSTTIGGLIIAEASLSFLGFGVPPPNPSWGGMMSSEGRTYMVVAPWLLIAPALALSLVVFATNMFGDAVRDELDPRMRGR